MKKMNSVMFFLFLSCFLYTTHAQKRKTIYKNEIIKLDTLTFPLQDKFQSFVNNFENEKYYLPLNENNQFNNILNSKLKVYEYAKFLINLELGKKYPKHPKKFTIGEDKDKNLWFVNCHFSNAVLDGNVYLIIVKSNCKILFSFRLNNP